MNDKIEKLKELSEESKRKTLKKNKSKTYTEPFLRDNADEAIDPETTPIPKLTETAVKFIDSWDLFMKDHISKGWKEEYSNNTKWTKFILGSKQSDINKDSPLGDAILNQFKKSKVRYRKEDGLFDLSIASTNTFKEIKSQHESKEDRKLVIKPEDFYPTSYEILIEVENEVEKCYEEMTKLIYAKSKLKVLITYNWDSSLNQNYYHVKDILKGNFRKIIEQSDVSFSENAETQYMLIVFQKKDDKLFWNNWVFASSGRPIIEYERCVP